MTMPEPRRTGMRAYDYDLPPELIAQEPLDERSDSRLLVLPRREGSPRHRAFRELPELLEPGDLLVVNDSRVIAARLKGNRESGAEVEVLLLRPECDGKWRALIRPWRRLREGERIAIRSRRGSASSCVSIVRKLPDGEAIIQLDSAIHQQIQNYGTVPLPPYITHRLDDDERYQTVYAEHPGSAAAPTAGLHFTTAILERLSAQGVGIASVTLHVGLDTFRPVTVDFAEDHVIHSEWCRVPPDTIATIRQTQARGGRVIAVGTTAARTLESLGSHWDCVGSEAFEAMTGIFIMPGYSWKVVDGLITNFHLPRSTLLMMVSALVGRERLLASYREAIAHRYRFYSFGDAMLILPEPDEQGMRE